MIELKFRILLDTNLVILKTFFPANLSAGIEKTKPDTKKSRNTKNDLSNTKIPTGINKKRKENENETKT